MHLQLSTNFLQRLATSVALGFGFWTIFVYFPPIYFSLTLAIILLLIMLFEWHRLFVVSSNAFWLLMPLYPILPFALLITLNHNPLYRPLLFALFIIVFSFDTGSYVMGNLFGAHPLVPRISKKKTWEGVAGGYLFGCVGLAGILYEQGITKSYTFVAMFAAVVCLLALFGDLFESFLKRRAHVKDSGTLLPGHGGFLDRFDGILFAVFFFYFLRNYLIQFFV